jgi:hypothetical protein
MNVSQPEFRAALLDPCRPAPPGLTDPLGRPAGKRFNVYRNNVAVSLTEALELSYPAVRKLVGDDFFKAMAGVYLRQHPPDSPLLMLYGASFPGFVESFAPARSLPYLGDVAQLELALREAYHAADAPPCPPEALQALPGGDLTSARLELAPALRLVRSRWPVLGIWAYNIRDTAPPDPIPQDVLITRPDFDPEPVLLSSGGAAFIAALQEGRLFGAALAAAQDEAPGFDLTATLGQMISGGAIIGVIPGDFE